MSEPLEIERKFLVKNFQSEFIPSNAEVIHITQDYLLCDGPGVRRARKSVCNGKASYFYTEKVPTGKSGIRIERERQIDLAEYTRLLDERDASLNTIEKTRYAFSFGGKTLELDVFEGAHKGLIMLEIELEQRDEKISIPNGWETVEVTDDHSYENYSLARA